MTGLGLRSLITTSDRCQDESCRKKTFYLPGRMSVKKTARATLIKLSQYPNYGGHTSARLMQKSWFDLQFPKSNQRLQQRTGMYS